MTSTQIQIKNAFEKEGMTVEEIAEDMSLELVAIKACLMQCSSQYRRACGMEDTKKNDLNFDDTQAEDFLSVIHEIATDRELDANVRLKAAIYGRDDHKGRKDVVKAVQGGQFNILNINQMLLQAKEKMKESLPPMNVLKQIA